MPQACLNALARAGYNATSGTFGCPYQVKQSASYARVLTRDKLLDLEEQEIVFVNTAGPTPDDYSPPPVGDGIPAFWRSAALGVVDPRPLAMHFAKNDCNRLHANGGIFVVIASDREETAYLFGQTEYGSFGRADRVDYSNWDFLGLLSEVTVSAASGSEIAFDSRRLGKFLHKGSKGARYCCTLSPRSSIEKNWLTLAKNKYGKTVAAAIAPVEGGAVLILPQMPNLHELIVGLVEDWTSQWSPQFFPHLEKHGWIHSPRYEMPGVVALSNRAEEVQAKSSEEIAEIHKNIETLRASNAHWYKLLNGTGRDLVTATIRALTDLGFENIVDVDVEAKANATSKQLREDVQIHDRRPTLIVDIKGVSGIAEDEEARQSEKHAAFRMKDWKRTDVQPLTILNAQRHIPPHDRDPKPYRKEIVEYAEDVGLGLLTTWDLLVLLRSHSRWSWPAGSAIAAFYRVGRIEPVPAHYTALGAIEKVWQGAIGLTPSLSLRNGDIIAIRSFDEYDEIAIQSLQVENDPKEQVDPGTLTGIGCPEAQGRFKAGQRVYLVNKQWRAEVHAQNTLPLPQGP
jgi:hypothetical protein